MKTLSNNGLSRFLCVMMIPTCDLSEISPLCCVSEFLRSKEQQRGADEEVAWIRIGAGFKHRALLDNII